MESKVSLANHSVLAPEILPTGSVRTTRLSEASSGPLVTGGTGFLGAFLLAELLRATGQSTRYYCLVRDRASGQGKPGNRVLETLKFYGLLRQSMEGRIVPVLGEHLPSTDGTEQREISGVGRRDRPDISLRGLRQLRPIPMRWPSPTLSGRNIGGAQVCLHGRNKNDAIHLIQRCLPRRRRKLPTWKTNRSTAFVDRMEGGYNQAKWVAEKLVWSAVSRGLPACIFRPGNIGHHSSTGTVNPNDFQSLIIKACARSGSAPLVPDWRFEMTPGRLPGRCYREVLPTRPGASGKGL